MEPFDSKRKPGPEHMLDMVMHHNEGDTPDATEDTTTTQQEAVVPYPVINTVDNQPTKDPELRGFDHALIALKAGRKVARIGWNGKGMWLYLVPGSTFQVAEGKPLAAHLPIGETVKYHGHIDMKTADNQHVPWLASQTDMLAEDWVVL